MIVATSADGGEPLRRRAAAVFLNLLAADLAIGKRAFAIHQIVAEAAKLKRPEIKAIGERVDCHLTGRTKDALLSSLENWLSDIKASAEQSAFTLTGVGER